MSDSGKTAKLRQQGLGLIIGLSLQFILGIITNLYIKFPDTSNRNDLWHTIWSNVASAAHAVLGILLVLGSLTLLVRSLRKSDSTWKIASVIGFVGILVAGFSGSQFVSTQNDAYSLAMALGFIVAVIAYAWGLFKDV